MVGSEKSVHIVVVSFDGAIANPALDSEPFERQREYTLSLNRYSPDSHVTYLILSGVHGASFKDDTLSVRSFSGTRILRLLKALSAFLWIQLTIPASLLVTQSTTGESIFFLILGRVFGIRVLGQIHGELTEGGESTESLPSLTSSLMGILSKRMLRYFSGLRVVSPIIESQLRARNYRKEIRVIPVPSRSINQELPRGKPEWDILFVGRLVPIKRAEVFIITIAQVINEFPNLRCAIVGEGPLRYELERRIAEHHLESTISLLGYVPHDQVGTLISSAKILLHPTEKEGFGRALVEAQAHGACVVARASAGARFIVEDSVTGLLCESDTELAGALRRVLSSDELRESLAINARASARGRFSSQKLIDAWALMMADYSQNVPSALIAPRVRTLHRWYRVACSRYTILRALMYEAIAGVELKGSILDIGGGKKNSYHHLFSISGKITTVNIDPKVEPDLISDLNFNLPLESESFDTVISLNTFEHLINDRGALQEALRVLRPGGAFHILVPFLRFTAHQTILTAERRAGGLRRWRRWG